MSNLSTVVIMMQDNGVKKLLADAKNELSDNPDDCSVIEESIINNFGEYVLELKHVKFDESIEYVKFLRNYLEKKDTEGVDIDFYIHHHNNDVGGHVEVIYDSLGVVEVETKLKW